MLESQQLPPDTAAQQDFPTMIDVETALDEAVIEMGLVRQLRLVWRTYSNRYGT